MKDPVTARIDGAIKHSDGAMPIDVVVADSDEAQRARAYLATKRAKHISVSIAGDADNPPVDAPWGPAISAGQSRAAE